MFLDAKGQRRREIKKWAGVDSNHRRLTPTGLQPVPFSHSGTDPNQSGHFIKARQLFQGN